MKVSTHLDTVAVLTDGDEDIRRHAFDEGQRNNMRICAAATSVIVAIRERGEPTSEIVGLIDNLAEAMGHVGLFTEDHDDSLGGTMSDVPRLPLELHK